MLVSLYDFALHCVPLVVRRCRSSPLVTPSDDPVSRSFHRFDGQKVQKHPTGLHLHPLVVAGGVCVLIDQPSLRRVTGATQQGGNSLHRPPDWPDTENPASSKCISHLWLSEKPAWYRGTSRSQLFVTSHCDLESLFAILCC